MIERSLTRWAFFGLLLLSMDARGSAQTVLYRLEGSLSPLDDFGTAVASLGDVDADSYPDLLVTAPSRSNGTFQTGAAIVYSGASGAILRTHYGPLPSDRIGNSATNTGDITGDGVSDYCVGAVESDYGPSNSGSIFYHSGSSGTLIRRVDGTVVDGQMGTSLCALGDVNGDGVPDQATGNYRRPTVNGFCRVISGADGSTVFTLLEPYPTGQYTVQVAGIGDLDGDSIGDIVIGSDSVNSSVGAVRIVSGTNGTLIRQLASPGGEFGRWVASAGDVDGDGLDDVIASAPSAPPTGRVDVYSGATGAVLRSFFGNAQDEHFGERAMRCGDMDGDGVDEFVISASYADNTSSNSGTVSVFSGLTSALLYRFDGDDAGVNLGNSIASLGDVNGDGICDLAAAQWKDQPGSVKVFSGTCSAPPGSTYCVGFPNSTGSGATIGYTGSPSISAASFALTVDGCPPNKVGLFIFAPNESQFAFGNGVKCVTGDYTRRIQPAIVTNPAGSGFLLLDFSSFPTNFLPGANPKFQFWYRDPPGGGPGFNTSDALSISFCP